MRRTLLIALLVVVGVLLLVPAGAGAAGYVHLQTWGGAGSSDGHFSGVLGGIWADSKGSVWVCDRTNNRVERFTSDGAFMAAFGAVGTGNGQFNSPNGVCYDEVNNVLYVADSFNNRVQRFTRNGDYLSQWGTIGTGDYQFNNPQAIWVDSSGNVYVGDTQNSRVQVYDAAGTYLRTIGSTAVGNGEFSSYTPGLAVAPDGTCYVADFLNSRVAKFDAAGAFVQFIGSAGSGDGQLTNPYGLAFDKHGNLLVADRANNRISRFATDGTWLDSYGSLGAGDGQFNIPSGIASGPGGLIYTTEWSNNRVQKLAYDDTAPRIFDDYAGDWFSSDEMIGFFATDDYAGFEHWDFYGGLITSTDPDFPITMSILPAPPMVATISVPMVAYDNVGNARERIVNYRVDTIPPVTTVSGAPSGWTNSDVTLQFAATDRGSGVQDTLCDASGSWDSVGADNQVTVSTEGVTNIEYYSYDSAVPMPNAELAKSVDVRIDKMGPDAAPSNNVTVRRNASATFKYTLNDNFSPTCTVKLVIKKKTKTVKTVTLGVKDSTLIVPPHSYAKKLKIGLAAGSYTWTVVATDLAGNIGSYAPKKLKVTL